MELLFGGPELPQAIHGLVFSVIDIGGSSRESGLMCASPGLEQDSSPKLHQSNEKLGFSSSPCTATCLSNGCEGSLLGRADPKGCAAAPSGVWELSRRGLECVLDSVPLLQTP